MPPLQKLLRQMQRQMQRRMQRHLEGSPGYQWMKDVYEHRGKDIWSQYGSVRPARPRTSVRWQYEPE